MSDERMWPPPGAERASRKPLVRTSALNSMLRAMMYTTFPEAWKEETVQRRFAEEGLSGEELQAIYWEVWADVRMAFRELQERYGKQYKILRSIASAGKDVDTSRQEEPS